MRITDGDKILLIPKNGLGDNLMFLPVAYQLKSQDERTEIHMMSNTWNGAADISMLSPYIDKVIEFYFKGHVYTAWEYLLFFVFRYVPLICRIRKEHYNAVLAIDPNPLIRSLLVWFPTNRKIVNNDKKQNQYLQCILLLNRFENIRLKNDFHELIKIVNEKNILEHFGYLGNAEYIICNFYGTCENKTEMGSRELLFSLAEVMDGRYKIVLIGINPDHEKIEHSQIIDLVNETNIAEAAVIIKHAIMVITVDSGMMHLGITFKRPIIAFFKVIHSTYLEPIIYDYKYFKAFDQKSLFDSFENLRKNLRLKPMSGLKNINELCNEIMLFINDNNNCK